MVGVPPQFGKNCTFSVFFWRKYLLSRFRRSPKKNLFLSDKAQAFLGNSCYDAKEEKNFRYSAFLTHIVDRFFSIGFITVWLCFLRRYILAILIWWEPRPTLQYFAQGEAMFKFFSFSCLHKTPYNARKGWARKLCPIFFTAAGWPKKCEVQKMLSPFIHPRPGGPPESLPRYARPWRGGAPFGGGWKDLTFFGLYIFCPASCFAAVPRDCRTSLKEGGATSKNVLVFGLCMCLSRNVKTSHRGTHPIIKPNVHGNDNY